MLTIDELRAGVEAGEIDTVIAAFTDMQGRLMGKRLDAEFFLDELDAGSTVAGSTKTVSERFISRAIACIVASSRSRPSVKTASWLPVKGSSVKTSAST